MNKNELWNAFMGGSSSNIQEGLILRLKANEEANENDIIFVGGSTFLVAELIKFMKSWREKLNINKSFVVKKLDNNFSDMKVGENMLIATPKIIDEYINQIPKGINVNIKTLRKDLALTYNADTTCPVTTGIFLRIVSEAAYEDFLIKFIFWRVIDHESKTASKLACGGHHLKSPQYLVKKD